MEVTVFLMASSVVAAKAGQKTPDGYYNVERMLKRVLSGNGKVLLCGTCMDARGLDDAALMAGARRSTMDKQARGSDCGRGQGLSVLANATHLSRLQCQHADRSSGRHCNASFSRGPPRQSIERALGRDDCKGCL